MGFAQFHSADDAKVGEPVPALLEALEVAGHVHPRWSEEPLRRDHGLQALVQIVGDHGPGGEVRVFGEGHRGQPDVDSPGARALHGAVQRIPGPLAVDVTVRGQEHVILLL